MACITCIYVLEKYFCVLLSFLTLCIVCFLFNFYSYIILLLQTFLKKLPMSLKCQRCRRNLFQKKKHHLLFLKRKRLHQLKVHFLFIVLVKHELYFQSFVLIICWETCAYVLCPTVVFFHLFVIESFLPVDFKSFVENVRVTLKNVCSVINLHMKIVQKEIIFLFLLERNLSRIYFLICYSSV